MNYVNVNNKICIKYFTVWAIDTWRTPWCTTWYFAKAFYKKTGKESNLSFPDQCIGRDLSNDPGESPGSDRFDFPTGTGQDECRTHIFLCRNKRRSLLRSHEEGGCREGIRFHSRIGNNRCTEHRVRHGAGMGVEQVAKIPVFGLCFKFIVTGR